MNALTVTASTGKEDLEFLVGRPCLIRRKDSKRAMALGKVTRVTRSSLETEDWDAVTLLHLGDTLLYS